MLSKNNDGNDKKRGEDMAVLNKPTVYEIKTSNENYNRILQQINEPRITKEFLEGCKKVSEKLRKEDKQ